MFSQRELLQIFEIEGQILQFCGPIFFSNSSELKPLNVCQNATFGLVETSQRKLLVTCYHVWEEFLKLRQNNSDAKIAVLLGGNYPVELKVSEPIGKDEELDLATFDVGSILLHCNKRSFYSLHSYPPPKIKNKDILAFIGYTGESRETSIAGAEFGYTAFGLSVSDVSGLRVVADLSKTNTIYDRQVKQQSPYHGGISGSPCFQLLRNGCLRLVGFATSEALGLIQMTHAACLNTDGTISNIN